jgi:hypothetical protein
MWILLKTPHNRRVLGQAMQVNPAASKLVKGMVNKIQDTIDVAEVGEQVRPARCGRGCAVAQALFVASTA